jgi:hypothetical protein
MAKMEEELNGEKNVMKEEEKAKRQSEQVENETKM